MPLKDKYEGASKASDGGWSFACEVDRSEAVTVKVTAEAVHDTAPAGMGDQTKFDGNRATYLRIASEKFDRMGADKDGQVIVTNYDVQGYEHT